MVDYENKSAQPMYGCEIYGSVLVNEHRNNRHRMRAPIFSQSKICLHKMAHSKGHFYSVQTPVARNFALLRGVRLFFSNTVFLKSLKTRLN